MSTSRSSSRTERPVFTPAQEIDALYRDLRRLERRPSDPSVTEAIESNLSRLRELQREEATAIRERLEAASSLPPGSGLAAIREAKKLLGRDEDPASPNPALRHQG